MGSDSTIVVGFQSHSSEVLTTPPPPPPPQQQQQQAPLPSSATTPTMAASPSLEEVSNVKTMANPSVHKSHLRHEGITWVDKRSLWYKEAVFYEVYVRAFCDGNGDGIGDLVGLTSKLDYIHELGVDCIWLLPIYPSPLRDDGYDVADYCGIHPQFGNLQDFRTFVEAVHERNMRVIVDFVANHTSDLHPWFQQSRLQLPDSKYTNYYVWSDDPHTYKGVRIIFCDTEESNWSWDPVAKKYFWHRFFKTQPDLNFDNPDVREEMFNVMKFWLDIGVDGFRCDAVPYLFEREGTSCENLPETHDFLKLIRKWLDENYPHPRRIMLSEANMWPKDAIQYFGEENGDEFHMGFHFPVMPRLFMALKKGDKTCILDILNDTPDIPTNCQWVTFLRNHDELTLEMVTEEERQYMWREYAPEQRMRLNLGIRRRLAPLLDNDRRKIELLYSLLFSLPGSPIIYYGDEIGMGDNIHLFDRNGVRTPMQWEPEPVRAGFSYSSKSTLYAPVINTPPFDPAHVNVKSSMRDSASLFNCIKKMLRTRKKHSCFGWGDISWVRCLNGQDDQHDSLHVIAFKRQWMDDLMLIVCNLTDSQQIVRLQLQSSDQQQQQQQHQADGNMTAQDVLTSLIVQVGHQSPLSLSPYQFLWLNLNTENRRSDK